MTGPVLKVDPASLRTVGGAFGQAGDQLAGIRADQPFADAAASVPQLATAGACQSAMTEIASEMTSHTDGARAYGSSLAAAADQYEATGQSAAAAITAVDIPK